MGIRRTAQASRTVIHKRLAVSVATVVGAAGLSVGAVAIVGSPANAACPATSGASGSGSSGGAGGTGGTSGTCGGTTLFTDDFLQDPSGFCVTTLTHWNIAPGGDVDVYFPAGASGQAVDLDGSANICGGDGTPVVSLKNPISVVAGRTYTARFRISTNPSPFAPTPPDVNSVKVNFGPATGTFTKQASQQGVWTTESLTFVASANGTAALKFEELGAADRGGIVLDRVDVIEGASNGGTGGSGGGGAGGAGGAP
jgi:hypothetical protein